MSVSLPHLILEQGQGSEGKDMAFAFPAYSSTRLSTGTTSSDSRDTVKCPHCGEYIVLEPKSSDLRDAVKKTLAALAWSVRKETSEQNVARIGWNWRSWGEVVFIDFLPDNTIANTSQCVLLTQCLDWGKNKDNITKFATEFTRHA